VIDTASALKNARPYLKCWARRIRSRKVSNLMTNVATRQLRGSGQDFVTDNR